MQKFHRPQMAFSVKPEWFFEREILRSRFFWFARLKHPNLWVAGSLENPGFKRAVGLLNIISLDVLTKKIVKSLIVSKELCKDTGFVRTPA